MLLISETPFEAIRNTSMCWTVVHSESIEYTIILYFVFCILYFVSESSILYLIHFSYLYLSHTLITILYFVSYISYLKYPSLVFFVFYVFYLSGTVYPMTYKSILYLETCFLYPTYCILYLLDLGTCLWVIISSP